MGIGIKLNALGMALALVFSKWYEPLYVAGAIIIFIGLCLLFFGKGGE
jgi:hypothetical protein